MNLLEFSTFFGRFHPVLVHLPIGFLMLAIILEWFESFRRTGTKSRLIRIAWLMGGISAGAAALCGWYLGETGLYDEDILFVHRWLGIALVIVSFLGWWIKRSPSNFSPLIQHGFNILVLGMIVYEGHQGGNLTHGEEYLTEFAPASVQRFLGTKKEKDFLPEFANPDSVLVYNNLVLPIFKSKCFACHDNEVQRGGLNMASPDSLMKGSQGDPIIVANSVDDSELFKRITLPQRNIKFMPPIEDPLTYDEIKIVEWWINTGASFTNSVSSIAVDDDIKPVLMRRYQLNTEPRPWYETVKLPQLDSMRIEELRQVGFSIKSLGATNSLLDVSYEGQDLTKAKITKLEQVKDYITWLSLADTNVKDEWLPSIGKMKNLTRLELEKTRITDDGIAQLTELQHLEAMNLYGTQVTDVTLANIEKITTLKRVYVWGTKVSPKVIKKAKQNNKGLEIISGER